MELLLAIGLLGVSVATIIQGFEISKLGNKAGKIIVIKEVEKKKKDFCRLVREAVSEDEIDNDKNASN